MPTPSVTGHCEHCNASAIQFELTRIKWISLMQEVSGDATKETHEAIGICTGCSRAAIFFLGVHWRTGSGARGFNERSVEANLTHYIDDQNNMVFLHRQIPSPEKPSVPNHLPPNVSRAFEDGEKSYLAGHWNQAAGSFGKSIDRGITPFLIGNDEYEKLKRPMLGQKLGILKKLDLLPPAMLSWIDLVKDDRNFALHDDDKDFDRKEDVEAARKFCRLLLEYLYTLPEEIDRAKAAQSAASDHA